SRCCRCCSRWPPRSIRAGAPAVCNRPRRCVMSEPQQVMNTENILTAQGVVKRYVEGPLDVTVLNGVDLSVATGQSLAIVGASGSGKSTLLHVLGGLDQPTQGRIVMKGQDWSSLSAARQGQWRNRHVGF